MHGLEACLADDIHKDEVVDVLRRLEVVELALDLTWWGRDAWGDCGHGTYLLVESTEPGSSYETSKFYEEEVIHGLRHVIDVESDNLDCLPEAVDLVRPLGSEPMSEYKKLGVHLGAVGLARAGIISVGFGGEINIPRPLYTASHYRRGGTIMGSDRSAHELLQDFNMAEMVSDIMDAIPILSIPGEHLTQDIYGRNAIEWWGVFDEIMNQFDDAFSRSSGS